MVIAVSLALPLAACAVGPDFVPPDAPVSNNFVGANNRSIRTDHQDYRDWWRAFRDPTLNRLVQIGYDQNLTLLSAGTRVLQARAVLGIAVGSFYPQVQQGVGDLTDEIEKLDRLKKAGSISEAEFTRLRSKLVS